MRCENVASCVSFASARKQRNAGFSENGNLNPNHFLSCCYRPIRNITYITHHIMHNIFTHHLRAAAK